jgi:hypothetical protein
MTTRVIKTETDRAAMITYLSGCNIPCTIDIVRGARRSTEQNKLQRMWLNEIAEQLQDQTPEEVRGYCKLTMGVPILRSENEAFCEKYDRIVKPLPYEQKIEVMMLPLSLPVTSIMTTDQKTRYLDAMYRHFVDRGLVLTEPGT